MTHPNQLRALREHAFKPGQPGANRGGPSKMVREIRDLAKKLLPEAIDRLAQIMRDGRDRDSIEAIKVLLTRGVGKELDADALRRKADFGSKVAADIDVKTLSDDQLEEIHAIVRRGLA